MPPVIAQSNGAGPLGPEVMAPVLVIEPSASLNTWVHSSSAVVLSLVTWQLPLKCPARFVGVTLSGK